MGSRRVIGGQKKGRVTKTDAAEMGLERVTGGQKRGRKKKGETSDSSSESTKSGSVEESTIQAEEKAIGGQKRGRKKKEIGGETSDLSSESVEETTDDGGGGGGFFACYLLTSLSSLHKGQTYIGFTVNPRRRIRQHNGEISSGAFRTKKKRPWEMVLCIYGFPTQVSALQFEWAWQHPLKSIKVKEAAATLKSLSGLANKIKLAYKMLNLPAWNSLNMTVNIFSSKYTIHSAGIDLPKHMKSQICSMDELPCYTDENGSGLLDNYNYDELDGEEDCLSDKHVGEDDDVGDKDISPLKCLSSSLFGGEKATNETFFESSYGDNDTTGQENGASLSDTIETHIGQDDENGGCLSDQIETHIGEDDENGGSLSDKIETRIGEDDDDDRYISPLKTFSPSSWLTNFELSDDGDDRNCIIIPIDKTHEVDVIDLLSPSPVHRVETCSKKKKKERNIMMDVIDLLSPSSVHRDETCSNKKKKRRIMKDVIDLTESPVFV